jgi:hypothetical protein
VRAIDSTDLSVAGIKKGMSSFAVSRLLGKPESKISENNQLDPSSKLYTWKYDGLSVRLYNDSWVFGISISSPRYSTQRGLRVGDSIKRLKQLYGLNFRIRENNWMYENPEYGYIIFITIKKNKVSAIYLGTLLD